MLIVTERCVCVTCDNFCHLMAIQLIPVSKDFCHHVGKIYRHAVKEKHWVTINTEFLKVHFYLLRSHTHQVSLFFYLEILTSEKYLFHQV